MPSVRVYWRPKGDLPFKDEGARRGRPGAIRKGRRRMNILFCGDGNIADGVLLSTLSLLEQVSEPLHIYLLTATIKRGSAIYEALPDGFAHFLAELVEEHRPGSTVERVDITRQFAAYLPQANMDTRFTPGCMLRLYADLLPELPERLLYLDNDVLCRRDPTAFYQQDMTGWELAGCLDYYGSWFFRRHPLRRDYLNSGVLLLNMAQIRRTGLFAACRERCRTTVMFMPDQSALNKLARRKKLCSRRYNEQRRLRRDTVFQHFTTGFRFFPWFHTVSVKPWNVEGMHTVLHMHAYDRLLEDYAREKRRYEEKERTTR